MMPVEEEKYDLVEVIAWLLKEIERLKQERDDYALLLFQPFGNSHHDANKCPYCQDNLNGKT